MSRIDAIRTAIATMVDTVFTAAGDTVTTSADPDSFGNIEPEEYPHARIIFVEEEPERLAFRQERRRVLGEIAIGLTGESATRELVNLRLEAIRDAIFADQTLGGLVDYTNAESGIATSSPDDSKKYGVLDITTEEVFS